MEHKLWWENGLGLGKLTKVAIELIFFWFERVRKLDSGAERIKRSFLKQDQLGYVQNLANLPKIKDQALTSITKGQVMPSSQLT